MSQLPAEGSYVDFLGLGGVYKVERVTYIFEDVSAGLVERITYKAKIEVSLVT